MKNNNLVIINELPNEVCNTRHMLKQEIEKSDRKTEKKKGFLCLVINIIFFIGFFVKVIPSHSISGDWTMFIFVLLAGWFGLSGMLIIGMPGSRDAIYTLSIDELKEVLRKESDRIPKDEFSYLKQLGFVE